MLTLSQEQVRQVEGLIAQMPGQYAIALLNIMNAAAQAQNEPHAEEPTENGLQE